MLGGSYKMPLGFWKILNFKSASRFPISSEKQDPINKIFSLCEILKGKD
jgi:hypothetical protein